MILYQDCSSHEVYRLANQFRRENTDVVGDKPVKNDAGEMSMSEDSKQKAWLEHYQRLLNVEFDWDPDHLSYQPPMEGPPIPITIDMVKKAISQMKAGKAPGPSTIPSLASSQAEALQTQSLLSGSCKRSI